MRTAIGMAALGWGGLTGFVTAAMTGVWWQLPYFGAASLVGGVGTYVALWFAR